MSNFLLYIQKIVKRNKFLYFLFKPAILIFKLLSKRNRGLYNLKISSNNYKNIFILDTRIHSIIFDSVVLLIRGSNFFYKDKWTLIIYEDDNYRHGSSDINNKNLYPKNELYLNSLINIFLQSLLILPNPPICIKFVHNSLDLLNIIKQKDKIFPKDYDFLSSNPAYLVKNFDEKDCQDFRINQPILKATDYHTEIFEKYLEHRNIKDFITITIRTKSWGHLECNTDIDDLNLYLNYIKKNNLQNKDVLILPDTQSDVPKELMNLIESNGMKYHLFHHGSFSIPMRFLAYSKSKFNFGTTNGPGTILCFTNNHSFLILKDPYQGNDYIKFINEYNKKVFLNRKIIIYKKF